MSNSISISGFKEFEDKLKTLPNTVKKRIDSELKSSSQDWAKLAIHSVPIDQGRMKQAITSNKVSDLSYEVSCNVSYAPFIEWGTKSRKRVPGDLQNYASSISYQKSGDYYDFLNAILDWVKRKGIGRTYNVQTRRKNRQTKDEFLQIAEAIAFSIIRHGVKPQPFFFIHKQRIEKEFLDRMKNILN